MEKEVIKNTNDNDIRDAIKAAVKQVETSNSSDIALKFSEVALNLAHTAIVLKQLNE